MNLLRTKSSENWRLELKQLPPLIAGDVAPLTLKNFIEQAKKQINQAFSRGVDIQNLVNAQSRVVDQLLYHLWTSLLTHHRPQWSLVAVGGYGRAELHPGSDVDLMILIHEKPAGEDSELISQFITLIWDSGLELGHSVRTVKDCVTEAKKDITVATNLMEARLVAGSPLLFDEMRHLTGPAYIWPGESFYKAKFSEQKERHKHFFSSSYSLEPNIKESPGGLRDIQMIGWVAKRHFQVDSLSALASFGFLTPGEIKSLQSCMFFLWRVRFALHQVAGRREDRLIFDYQGAVAELLGYGKASSKESVEQLMKAYYRKVLRIRELNDMLLQLFNQAILSNDKKVKIVTIDNDFQIKGKYIEARNDRVFIDHPSNLLRVFVHLADHPELRGIRAETIRLLQNSLHLIDEEFRDNSGHKQLFISLLSQHGGINHAFVFLKRYGVLKRYLPVYARIVGQMQFDLFHVYTVDEHTLFLMKNIARFSVSDYDSEFPLCSKITRRLKRPEIIYIAALFHDIGKGRGGDHSELGAEDAYHFCISHDLRLEDAELVSWLVKNHLLMSMVAQRKDISSPEIIAQFAASVQETRRLNLLYILTVADIRATNPTLWNGWKEGLLKELYYRTKDWLKSPEMRLLDSSEFAAQNKKEAAGFLQTRKIPLQCLHDISAITDNSYFQKYSANQVAWHIQSLYEAEQNDQPLIKIRRHPNEGASEIFIYCHDRKGLFSDISQTLYDQQLNIVNSTIHTLDDGYCIDTFIVLELDGKPLTSSRRNQLVAKSLMKNLSKPEKIKSIYKAPRQYKHFAVKTQFKVHYRDDRKYLELDLTTLDKPGLLAQIGSLFNQLDIRLHGAKIATFGERTEDLFLVTLPEKYLPKNNRDFSTIEKLLTRKLENLN
ncbi:MAG TPA: [protein-PII] uridylyltransferase [Aeromonadales bacterium]|nr:[protein-PII] uridylyltransferase [Aeromonadales bacterium]